MRHAPRCIQVFALFTSRPTSGMDVGVIFRWFEELGPICELLRKVSEIGASKIKFPIGRVLQKYVYTCFMVKMRIN